MAGLGAILGFGSPRKKNSKAARLRRKMARIKKLERKVNSPKYKRAKALDAALAAADKRIATLQGK